MITRVRVASKFEVIFTGKAGDPAGSMEFSAVMCSLSAVADLGECPKHKHFKHFAFSA
jgi:hypothetical protein